MPPRRYQRESGAGRSAPRDPDAGQPDLFSPGRSARLSPGVTWLHTLQLSCVSPGVSKKIICYDSCLLDMLLQYLDTLYFIVNSIDLSLNIGTVTLS